ncbi:sulfate anion transporter [Auricularia subglabra TFB-10046 SS5]|nr:sulfate anion transporter [Auricularia subglabra TFB-10046 SS5]
MLLNVLDGVSYGLIMFPPAAVFEGFGAIGVSMFFATTVISQLVYTFGGSGFAGANGSMIIEVVPFFHLIATAIIQELGPDADPRDIIATTMVAFALSSVLTGDAGIAFLALGFFKLGNLISFFPRHILIGCIGGVGWFLIETGLEVCGGLKEESFKYNWEQFSYFFLKPHVLALWLPAFVLAVTLRCITHRWDHQLIFPMYFISICAIFYIVVAIGRLELGMLRREGWVFDLGDAGHGAPWWKFYTYFDFGRTNLYCLWITMPTQMALLFFNLLHPPLNIPALAISLDHHVNTNKELVAHGYSNLLAGLLGTVPNYIVYVNSLLFYRVGGGSRIAGFLLALATFGLLIIGTGPIAYIPVMLVGALIFVLGIDLMKEAVWDTRHRVSRFEYITIWSIIFVMSVWDFVIGVLAGIVFCCALIFTLRSVIQTSQARSIRTLHTGSSAMSTVRRPPAHREYIKKVAKQTAIMRLQGFIFFGTITKVEASVKKLMDAAQWANNPIRFLVVDFSLVLGVDISSAEALVRLQRLLDSKSVMMIFCGIADGSPVWRSLKNVEIFNEHNVEQFDTMEQAIEWTENAYIRAWFLSQGAQATPVMDKVILPAVERTPISWGESYVGSPRRNLIRDAGQDLISRTLSTTPTDPTAEPVPTLMKVFWSLADVTPNTFQRVLPYLRRTPVPEGQVLWSQGDQPDGIYVVETGLLRAIYDFGPHTPAVQECMVAGTISGELSALAGLPRNATVIAERASVLWKLSTGELERMHTTEPDLARLFTELILKVAKVEYDVLISSLAGRA